MQAADLTSAACWDNVVDFRWHKTTPSPHWRVIEQTDRHNPLLLLQEGTKAIRSNGTVESLSNRVDIVEEDEL